jgi:hydroxymethylglutaryl-CoA reductase
MRAPLGRATTAVTIAGWTPAGTLACSVSVPSVTAMVGGTGGRSARATSAALTP